MEEGAEIKLHKPGRWLGGIKVLATKPDDLSLIFGTFMRLFTSLRSLWQNYHTMELHHSIACSYSVPNNILLIAEVCGDKIIYVTEIHKCYKIKAILFAHITGTNTY